MNFASTLSLLLMAATLLVSTPSAGQQVNAPEKPLATLRQEHPRLMLTNERLESLKAMSEEDATLRRYVEQALAQAEVFLKAEPLTYDVVGPRLLHVSRACLDRVYALALAFRWTGEEKYAKGVRDNLLTVCAFPDWNESHFLDVAEMAHAVAIGYDWTYDVLSVEDREHIQNKLIEYALEHGLKAYENWTWWPDSEHNWNQVCNSGLAIGALAIAETHPAYAEQIIPFVCKSIPNSLATYAPDGAWPEGPSYWHYATVYTAYGLCALRTALGTDFGLSTFPGMAETGLFPLYTTGPTGLYLNFADSGERGRRRPMPVLFWLADTYRKQDIANAEHQLLREHEAVPEHVVWYVPETEQPLQFELDRVFDGPVQVAVFRSAWEDPQALWLGVKGGYNEVNHGQLDLGNFELDALGVRWARDLGSDNYNLPGYFDKKPGGKRWDYYRMLSTSHSVPLINGQEQAVQGKAKLVEFHGGDAPFVVFDLTEAYPGLAKRVTRKMGLTGDRRSVQCEDTFLLETASDVTWAMVTDAELELQGSTAILALDGKRLVAEALAPAGATFTVESAEQESPQKQNKGVRRLLLHVPGAQGEVTVQVKLSPEWPE